MGIAWQHVPGAVCRLLVAADRGLSLGEPSRGGRS